MCNTHVFFELTALDDNYKWRWARTFAEYCGSRKGRTMFCFDPEQLTDTARDLYVAIWTRAAVRKYGRK